MTTNDIRRRLADLETRITAAVGCDTCRGWGSFIGMQMKRDMIRARHELAQFRLDWAAQEAGLPAPERLPMPPEPEADPADLLAACPTCERPRPEHVPLSVLDRDEMRARARRPCR